MKKLMLASIAAVIFSESAWGAIYINENDGTGTVFREGELVGYYNDVADAGGTVTFLTGTQAYMFDDAPHGYVYNAQGEPVDEYFLRHVGGEAGAAGEDAAPEQGTRPGLDGDVPQEGATEAEPDEGEGQGIGQEAVPEEGPESMPGGPEPEEQPDMSPEEMLPEEMDNGGQTPEPDLNTSKKGW